MASRADHECSLLMAASGGGFLEVASQLIKAGADPNFKGKNNKTGPPPPPPPPPPPCAATAVEVLQQPANSLLQQPAVCAVCAGTVCRSTAPTLERRIRRQLLSHPPRPSTAKRPRPLLPAARSADVRWPRRARQLGQAADHCRGPSERRGRLRLELAVGETVISLTPPVLSLLERLLKVRGGVPSK